ncbi:hypothetical protein HPB47_002533 [Ixodes persulcatus]|uniref:Uncharacterized protein n=1 Tax=Ixodes persulcatus TaxID=34615 RepID=A0AC60PLA5_IXOPE|nr:hypothetical protein HPB47_002533 [Ixodes persulcatus]
MTGGPATTTGIESADRSNSDRTGSASGGKATRTVRPGLLGDPGPRGSPGNPGGPSRRGFGSNRWQHGRANSDSATAAAATWPAGQSSSPELTLKDPHAASMLPDQHCDQTRRSRHYRTERTEVLRSCTAAVSSCPNLYGGSTDVRRPMTTDTESTESTEHGATE